MSGTVYKDMKPQFNELQAEFSHGLGDVRSVLDQSKGRITKPRQALDNHEQGDTQEGKRFDLSLDEADGKNELIQQLPESKKQRQH